MISIIIASVNEAYKEAIADNIAATIGVPFELMIIPNGKAPTGLCELYNKAAARAAFDCLVFAHEDLEFRTPNWGPLLLAHVQAPGTGAVGLAGPLYYPALPAPLLSDDDARVMHMLQGKGPGDAQAALHSYNPGQREPVKSREVAAIDGCFIAVSKAAWERFPFNEQLLKGFHFYDLDFTLRLRANGLHNRVFFDILICHFSGGSYNKGWFLEGERFWRHWKRQLPLYVEAPSPAQVKRDYWKCLFHYCWNIRKAGLGAGYLLRQFFRFAGQWRFFSMRMLVKLLLQPVYHRMQKLFPEVFTRKDIF